MDVALMGIVSDLVINLTNPLSEVSEIPFERLVDGTTMSKMRSMSGKEVVGNNVTNIWISQETSVKQVYREDRNAPSASSRADLI